jgi:hypothetical protein
MFLLSLINTILDIKLQKNPLSNYYQSVTHTLIEPGHSDYPNSYSPPGPQSWYAELHGALLKKKKKYIC